MDIAEVLRFLEGEKFAVLATASEDGKPEAALMGFAVTPELEIIFDTVKSFRKYPNLKKNPRVAWVIGCSSEISVQFEGNRGGVGRDGIGEVQGHLREEISRQHGTRQVAGPDVLPGAAQVGAVWRLHAG